MQDGVIKFYLRKCRWGIHGVALRQHSGDRRRIKTSKIGSIKCHQDFITSASWCPKGFQAIENGYEREKSDWIKAKLKAPRSAFGRPDKSIKEKFYSSFQIIDHYQRNKLRINSVIKCFKQSKLLLSPKATIL